LRNPVNTQTNKLTNVDENTTSVMAQVISNKGSDFTKFTIIL